MSGTLLTRDDLAAVAGDDTRSLARSVAHSMFATGESGKRVAEVLGNLEDLRGKVAHYKTKSKWSTHQLLNYILRATGPARVHLATYTVSEDPARMLVRHRQNGSITELHCLFDYRLRTYNGAAYQLLAHNVDRIALVKNHSKVLVVENADWSVTAVTSSNMNNNRRIEVGILFTDPDTAEFYRSWIDEEITAHGTE